MGAARTHASQGLVLDAGALIALDRGDKRMIELISRALATSRKIRVPAGVLGQAWRNGRVQVMLARILNAREVEVVPLDERIARRSGELCALAQSSDIIDASVVIVARERGDAIVSSDPGDLRRLDPAAHVIAI